MDTREHEVEHEKFVGENVDALVDRAAIFKDLNDHESRAAGQRSGQERKRPWALLGAP